MIRLRKTFSFLGNTTWSYLRRKLGALRVDARFIRWALLLLGLLTLIGLIWHIGPRRILEAAAALGPAAVLTILLPSVLMYGLDSLGWRFTLSRYAPSLAFWRLCAIRMAGEVVNMTTPTASVGGEPLKAVLLKQGGVPMEDGLASVVVAKTTMTLAHIAFILLGISLAFWILPSSGSARSAMLPVLAALTSVGLLLFGTAVFLVVQRRGLFASLLGGLKLCRIRLNFLEARKERLLAVDRSVLAFYTHDRHAFFQSTGTFFLGWLAEALEVYAILYFLGAPTDLLTALAIDALSTFIKGGTSFIPGSLGAQDGGNLLLLEAFGFSELTGIMFALVRRLRELVWIATGLICLSMLGRRSCRVPEERVK